LLIAPGYFRCVSRVPRWSDSDPGEHDICEYEFQEGASVSPDSPLCACGTLAIGRCANCGAWFCGDHSGLIEGRRLCAAHYKELERKIKERQAAERATALTREQERTSALDALNPELVLDAFVDAMKDINFAGAQVHKYVYKSKVTYPLGRTIEKERVYPQQVWYLGRLEDRTYDAAYLATTGELVVFASKGVGARQGRPMPRRPVRYKSSRRAAVLR
jgi:hypothetical protein